MHEEFALIRDFAIIMAVAGVAIVLFRRLNQPPILGYLLAGLIVGPFTLPLIGLHAPVDNVESIRLLADLGLVLLLFALGLEFGWQRIREMGLRVVFIGIIAITFMVALGYQAALLIGWNSTDAIFLGAALTTSSSAIIIKVFRDTNTLFRPHARLVIGVSVVEDFISVLLLSVLAGIATTGTTNVSDVLSLMGKLSVFFISAVALGTLFAPRLIKFVAQFESRETLLIVSLALCFGLALVADHLGLSAAAGAFIMGTVLGDTDHSDELAQTMSPVRDIFAALFFVSIGMLIDLSLVSHFIIPAVVISVLFIVGKTFAVTLATFLAGHDGRTSLKVGMGMPQLGEFSLALIKVGADRAAVSSFLYPVVAVATGITALVYPYLNRSAEALATFLERRSPQLLKNYVSNLSGWLISLRTTFSLRSDVAREVQRAGRTMLINLVIIVVLIGVGTFLLGYTQELSELTRLRADLIGLIISIGVVTLCVPEAAIIWRSLQRMTDELAGAVIWRHSQAVNPSQPGSGASLRIVLRNSILVAMIVLVGNLSLPFVFQLLRLGSYPIIVPALLIIGVVALTWRAVFKIHENLEATFSQTFLGQSQPASRHTGEESR